MNIEGWDALTEWMGLPPVFHDGEITDLRLSAKGTSEIVVEVRGKAGDVGVVRIELFPPLSVRIDGWDRQNVILELDVDDGGDGCTFSVSASNGAVGTIKAFRARVRRE